MRLTAAGSCVVALLLTACGPEDYAPLYRYNDTWAGEVRFDGHPPLPLRADIYVTQVPWWVPVVGALLWLFFGRLPEDGPRYLGPDDDPDFLRGMPQ